VLVAGMVLVALAVAGRDRIAAMLAPGPDAGDAGPVRVPGFWHVGRPSPTPRPETPNTEERARLVSLPYLAGRETASGAGPYGVVVHDRERALEGLNLYTSGHGPEAVLMDMDGHVVHRWRYPFERAFPEMTPTVDTEFFRRARLLPGGRLLVLYQTGGLAFLDRGSHLLGRCPGNFYNDFDASREGRIWTLAKEVRSPADEAARLDDFLVLLEPGESGAGCHEVRRLSLTGLFRASPFADLLEPMAPAGDVLHSNAVTELDGRNAGASPLFAAGNLLVSIRELDLVSIVDPRGERVLWARRGPWKGQHDPSLLANGHLLLFDNQGGDGGASRLVEVDPVSGDLPWTWSGQPPSSFASAIAGTCARLANGNTLVTESVPGRAFELDPEGRVVWEFRTPHRAGPRDSLVAMLFDVQRLPIDAFPETSR
jgi:hypothetical protein